VDFKMEVPEHLYVKINPPLFEWVLENLLKNALDAMDGSGKIEMIAYEEDRYIAVEVKDSGKGISSSQFKTIFQPGFSTKKRGWGLGLTLTKRIVEQYHGGKIFVKNSEIDKGTTFKIELPKG
jgi:signal transduction histidine kinase